MKTNINRTITSQQEAELYLSDLISNKEIYHIDESAHDVIWINKPQPNTDECDKMDELMAGVFTHLADPYSYVMNYIKI